MEESIRSTIDAAPDKPGVYLWKDESGKILYVGKAESLRERLRSYLKPQDPKTARLVESAMSLETVLTKSEPEALILEDALVKQNQPRYNVRLRDDKRYPYIRVTVAEAYPRIQVVRRVELDGSRYFGPYTDPSAVRRVLRLVGEHFGVRQCNYQLARVKRPCINHRMGKCSAPCAFVKRDDYVERVERACRFLSGEHKALKRELRSRISSFSGRREFERAAELRDVLAAIESLSQRQDLSSASLKDMDVLGYGFALGRANVTQLQVRDHKVVAVLHYPLTGESVGSPRESMKAFIKQHYTTADLTPKLIVTSAEPADKAILEELLGTLTKSGVKIQTATRGQKLKLVELAVANSLHQMEQEKLRSEAPDPLDLLMQSFRLPRRPARIEGYDISNLGAKSTVGGMVVFKDGRAEKSQYRMFSIRSLGQDDPGNMAEMLERRFRHNEWKTPDLIVLDGGKAQLSQATPHIPAGVPVIALAKKLEEVYLPGRSQPVRLQADNPALLLLRQVRDEVHRFSKRYHTKKRGKGFLVINTQMK
jgi:excinuclease ABC subunit C